MSRVTSPRVITHAETDQQMLEGGGNRHYTDAIIARFGELIESSYTFRRSLEAIQDAHKLAMAQMQFAQTVVHQLENQVERD